MQDATDVNLCFQAASTSASRSYGNYCVYIRIGVANSIYLSGIVRDFVSAQNGFGLSAPIDAQSDVRVLDRLDQRGHIQLDDDADSEWFTSESSIVKSITLSNTTGYYTFSSTQWYPIDGLLLGNEDEAHNRFFSYEAHTYITYTGAEEFEFKSNDNLWVFVDWMLPSRWAIPLEASYMLRLDEHTGISGKLVIGKTYRIDIFYVHRSFANEPSLQLQLSDSIICNALSEDIIPSINYTSFNTFNGSTSSNPTTDTSAGDIASIDTIENTVDIVSTVTSLSLTGTASIIDASSQYDSGTLQLISKERYSASGAAWFSRRLRVQNGFSTDFIFRVDGGDDGSDNAEAAEGFAFVIQSASVLARGGEGPNLVRTQLNTSHRKY